MPQFAARILRWFGFTAVLVSYREQARASLSAAIGLVLTGVMVRLIWGDSPDLPILVPPIAASAVLVFAAPASPLAQPWNVVAGNVLSAIAGMTCARYLPSSVFVVAIAPAMAIGLMFLFRSLHPPGGAVALTALLGGPAIQSLGFGFALYPIALESVVLVGLGIAINRLLGRRYPHVVAPVDAPAKPQDPVGVTHEDVKAVLLRHDEVVDVDVEELTELVHEIELEAVAHRPALSDFTGLMQRAAPTVREDATLDTVRDLMTGKGLDILPVLDREDRLIGVITPLDLLRAREAGRGFNWLKPKPLLAAAMVRPNWPAVLPETSVGELRAIMARENVARLPVIAATGRYLGIVDQFSLLETDIQRPHAGPKRAVG